MGLACQNNNSFQGPVTRSQYFFRGHGTPCPYIFLHGSGTKSSCFFRGHGTPCPYIFLRIWHEKLLLLSRARHAVPLQSRCQPCLVHAGLARQAPTISGSTCFKVHLYIFSTFQACKKDRPFKACLSMICPEFEGALVLIIQLKLSGGGINRTAQQFQERLLPRRWP